MHGYAICKNIRMHMVCSMPVYIWYEIKYAYSTQQLHCKFLNVSKSFSRAYNFI